MKRLLILSTALLALFACSKKDASVEKDGKARFYATTEKNIILGSKVFADEDLKVMWNEDDRISIFNRNTANSQYAFYGEDGDTGGDFEEEPANNLETGSSLEHIYAVYPFSSENQINSTGSQITVNLPADQAFKEHSFGIGANTMVAVTDNNFLGFKNVCGYLKFSFYGNNEQVSSVKLEGKNGEKIAGKAYVTPVFGGTHTVAMDETGTAFITINCADPVTIGSSSAEATDFIFVIPPTTFTGGFKITITNPSGKVVEKGSSRSLTISRNKMESMKAIFIDFPISGGHEGITEEDW